jgi:zinc ribbon protein
VATTPRFCGRCGAQLTPGAPFCGRCGTPVLAPAWPAPPPPPAYRYPVARRATDMTAGRYKLSQAMIAGGLLAVLALVTVAISAFAVSRFTGGGHSTCTANCAPKIVTPLVAGSIYRSSAFSYQVDYSSRWKIRSQDADGVLIGTSIGTLQFTGMRGGAPTQALQATVAALPTGTWQDVVLVSALKGAHLGDQDGVGAVYSANLIGSAATATQVRFAVIVASKNGVTVVMFAVNPADPKNSPNGMPEGQLFDYVCTQFAWS